MYTNYKDDLQMSKEIFNKVKPYLENNTASKIIAVEGAENALKALDTQAGIDYICLSDKGVRGLASRCQRCKAYQKPYRSFTIRVEKDTGMRTEYEKRKTAIEKGYLYPYYTTQIYEYPDYYLYAIAKTDAIYNLIDKQPEKVQLIRGTRGRNASFLVVSWDDLAGFCKEYKITKGATA